MKRIVLLIPAFLLLGSLFLMAQPATSDPSFNVADNCYWGSGESFNDRVNVTVIQADGKIVAGGDFTIYNGTGRNRLARLNTDGSLDISFKPGSGCNGLFSSYNPTAVNALAVQGDGKILAGGNFLTYNGNNSRGLVRVNTDGSIDKSFNIGSGFDAPVFKIVVQPDGKVLVGGNFTTFKGISRNRIARLHSDGSLDTSFNPGSGFNNWVRTIALLNNGKVMVGGFFNTYNGNATVRIARLNKNGSFDASFASGTGFQNEVTSILTLANGKILCAGHFQNYKGTFINRIVRIDSNGNIDNGFKPGNGFDQGVYSASLQSDGKIILGGAFTAYNYKTIMRLCRLHPDGDMDTMFKTGIEYIVGDIIHSTQVQADGKIIMAGKFLAYSNMNGLNHIYRINSDGSFDQPFNHGTGFQVAEVSDFAIQPDNKILAAGMFYSYNGTVASTITRLNADGTHDTSFRSRAEVSSTLHLIKLLKDGKILIGGGFGKYDNK